jgi:ParB-like chromosome segregation protein Spo0J
MSKAVQAKVTAKAEDLKAVKADSGPKVVIDKVINVVKQPEDDKEIVKVEVTPIESISNTSANPFGEYKIHPAADKFPLIQGEEFEQLKRDIKSKGQLEPIETFNGEIIDGRNRLRSLIELGIKPKFQEWKGEGSVIDYVISKNLIRRHLNESQRAMIAADLAEMYTEEALVRQKAGKKVDPNLDQGGRSNQKAADRMNISHGSVAAAKKVIKKGTEELKEAVKSGKVAVSTAAMVAELPKETQKEAVKKGTVKEVAKKVSANKAKSTKLKSAKKEQSSDLGKFTEIKADIMKAIQEISDNLRHVEDGDLLVAMRTRIEDLAKKCKEPKIATK